MSEWLGNPAVGVITSTRRNVSAGIYSLLSGPSESPSAASAPLGHAPISIGGRAAIAVVCTATLLAGCAVPAARATGTAQPAQSTILTFLERNYTQPTGTLPSGVAMDVTTIITASYSFKIKFLNLVLISFPYSR